MWSDGDLRNLLLSVWIHFNRCRRLDVSHLGSEFCFSENHDVGINLLIASNRTFFMNIQAWKGSVKPQKFSEI